MDQPQYGDLVSRISVLARLSQRIPWIFQPRRLSISSLLELLGHRSTLPRVPTRYNPTANWEVACGKIRALMD
jgi:hypothetical protein